jgi:ferrochelatase
MPPNHTAVLLMAYGSPNRLEDVEAYFTDIRGGRTPSREAVEELTSRYRRVGVPTPLLRVSMDLGRQLERLLNLDPPDDAIYTVHLGMKHWRPRIATAIDEIVESGADRLIGIVLAPHYSSISSGGYRRQVEAALASVGEASSRVDLDFVDSWHELDGYLEAVAENVRMVRAEFRNPEEVVAVFTAHSLPARILNEGDPYQEQLLRTSELVAQRAGIEQWRFSYQSQSHTGEPWLGPDLVETIEELAAQGHRAILVASVGFIADHLEIFYDIDIEAKERADALGIELRRTPMLNADPRLAHALHALVAQRSPHPALPGRLKRSPGTKAPLAWADGPGERGRGRQ